MKTKAAEYKKEIEWSKEDGAFIARAPELPGCVVHGDSEDEAFENLNEAIGLYLESMVGEELDAADGEKKFVLRMPALMHGWVQKIANAQNQSMNDVLLDFLDAGIMKYIAAAKENADSKKLKSVVKNNGVRLSTGKGKIKNPTRRKNAG